MNTPRATTADHTRSRKHREHEPSRDTSARLSCCVAILRHSRATPPRHVHASSLRRPHQPSPVLRGAHWTLPHHLLPHEPLGRLIHSRTKPRCDLCRNLSPLATACVPHMYAQGSGKPRFMRTPISRPHPGLVLQDEAPSFAFVATVAYIYASAIVIPLFHSAGATTPRES